MSPLLFTLLLALAWAAVTGSFSGANLLFGFAIGALALLVVRAQAGPPRYIFRAVAVAKLAGLVLVELTRSSLRVARLVLTPRMRLQPGIFAFPLTVESDLGITLLANLITLTPGTLSVDVSDDRRTLYIHALDCSDPARLRAEIAAGFERRIMEALQ